GLLPAVRAEVEEEGPAVFHDARTDRAALLAGKVEAGHDHALVPLAVVGPHDVVRTSWHHGAVTPGTEDTPFRGRVVQVLHPSHLGAVFLRGHGRVLVVPAGQ